MPEQKILLVQNEKSSLQALKKTLAKQGYAVSVCGNAFAAVDEMRTAPCDMIITTAELPDLSGFQLSSLFKTSELSAQIPIAIVGSADDMVDSFWKRASLADLVIDRASMDSDAEKVIQELQTLLSVPSQVDTKALSDHCMLPLGIDAADDVVTSREMVSRLLMERSANYFCRVLSAYTNDRVEFLNRYFGFMRRMFGCEVTGLFISDSQSPWGTYEFEKPISKSAFEKLRSSVASAFGTTEEPRMLIHGEVAEKGGASLKNVGTVIVQDHQKAILGVLVLGWSQKQTLDESARFLLEILRTQMQPIFRILLAAQEIQKLRESQTLRSSTDLTTGLYNLEFFMGFLQQQLLFSSRQKLPVGVTLIGIDNFEELNRCLGSGAADQILARLATKISAVVRSSDLLARYSGDQFALVLPNTDENGLKTLAEKLRIAVENMTWEEIGTKVPKITVSVGCAAFNQKADGNPEGILHEAKLALQAATKQGRNRVAV